MQGCGANDDDWGPTLDCLVCLRTLLGTVTSPQRVAIKILLHVQGQYHTKNHSTLVTCVYSIEYIFPLPLAFHLICVSSCEDILCD
jgi:hypothetical protein